MVNLVGLVEVLIEKTAAILSYILESIWASALKIWIFYFTQLRRLPLLFRFLDYSATLANTIYFVFLKWVGNGVVVLKNFFVGQHYVKSKYHWSTTNAHVPFIDWKYDPGTSEMWKVLNKDQVLTSFQLARLAYECPQIREYHARVQGGFSKLQEHQIDDLLIYTVKQEDVLYVVFKGTEPYSLDSIFADLNCALGPVKRSDFTIPGTIHQAWREIIFGQDIDDESLPKEQQTHPFGHFTKTAFTTNINIKNCFWNWFEKTHKNDIGKFKIVVSGHSMGGALSLIFAAALHNKYPSLVTSDALHVYAFAPPRVGDEIFSLWAHKALFGIMYKFCFQNEFATRVPIMTREKPFDFAEAPGSLVFAAEGKDPELKETSVLKLDKIPDIDFLMPHNLLNPYSWHLYTDESLLRRLERWILPFYIQDHAPSDMFYALSEC